MHDLIYMYVDIELDALMAHPFEHSERLKYQACCAARVLVSIVLLVSMIGLIIAICFSMPPSQQLLNHTQQDYARKSLTYSPFQWIDTFYYRFLDVFIGVDNDEDLNEYSLTVCAVPCPLKVAINHSWQTGACVKDRIVPNCFANLLGYKNYGSDAQQFSQYMLNNSEITFTVIDHESSQPGTVHLCVTANKDLCQQMFERNQSRNSDTSICVELLEFNTTNHYIQTFTATKDSYYCAVWLLAESQSMNYTINSTLHLYELPERRDKHSECKNFQKSANFMFDLRSLGGARDIALKRHDYVCLIIQESGSQLYRNITIHTTALASGYNNIAFVISVLLAILLLVKIFTVACCQPGHRNMLIF